MDSLSRFFGNGLERLWINGGSCDLGVVGYDFGWWVEILVSGLRFGFQWWWLADLGGSWVGDFRFAIWVSVCWSCVSVVVIWVGGFRFTHRLHVFCSSFACCWFVVGLLTVGMGFVCCGFGFCLVETMGCFFFFFLVLNVYGGLWVAGGCGVKCVLQHICLDEHLKSCSTINLAS